MQFSQVVFFVVLVSSYYALTAQGKKKNVIMDLPSCNYPGLYNFGDSNSDTGGIAAAFFQMVSPCGQTYFHRPVGRNSDGRLIIDFIAEHLGLPFLSAYLDSIGTNFHHGANFATGGATIRRQNEPWFFAGASPFPIDMQVEHYTQFKNRTAYFYNHAKLESDKNRLPRPQDFSKALYTFDIGQNDIADGFRKISMKKLRALIPDMIKPFVVQIRSLYKKGARVFWIHNTGPIGCLPLFTIKVQNPNPGYLDEHGCVKSQNDIAKEFNKELKNSVIKLRQELSEAAITYVDIYKAKYELISNAKKHGFEDPFKICCGIHGSNYGVKCGYKAIINGSQVFAKSCANPSAVISWDGAHYTDAANSWIASQVVNGSLSDPPTPITRACHRQI